jgi:hypothetical protein
MTRASRWRRALRSIEAAAIAGIVFSAAFVTALLLLSRMPAVDAPDEDITTYLADVDEVRWTLLGLQIVPVSVIALLWFMAVVRRRIGDREDRLFATVFLGGGILFAGMVLVGAAVIATPAYVADVGGAETVDPGVYRYARGLGAALLAVQGPRIGALFMLSTSTLGLRTGAFSRPLVAVGYLLALAMLVAPATSAARFIFPIWVGTASIELLIRRRRARAAGESHPGSDA